MKKLLAKNCVCVCVWGGVSPFKDLKASKKFFKDLQKKKTIRYENLPLQTKSGELRYVEFVSNLYQVGEKRVIQCNIRDITDRKIIADALQENEVRFRELFNRISSCVAVYEAVENGRDFIIKDFNAAAERVEKTPRQKVLGRKVTEVFPGIREMGLLKTFQQVWKTGKAQSHPVSIYKDNHIFGWRENFVYKLPPGEIVAIYEDATEHKQIEEKMAWLASFPEINPLFVLEVDPKLHVRYANHSVKREFPGIETADAHHPILNRLPEIMRQLHQENKKTITIEIEAGGKWYSEIVCTIANNPNYRIYANDITDLKSSELERKKSEEKYQRIIETAQEAICVTDLEMKITYANQQMTELLGYSAEEIIGYPLIDSYFPEDLPDLKRRMKSRMKGFAETYDRKLRRKDGSMVWTSVSASPLLNAQGDMEGTFAMFTDITERKRNENALQLMSDTQRQLIQLEDLKDVYQLVGTKIQELIGDGHVIINALDEPLQSTRVAGLFGFGSSYESLVHRFHIDPAGMTYPLKDMTPDELRLFLGGRLERFPGGLYNLMLRKVPKAICKIAEKRLGFLEIYTMGFIRHDTPFGGLTVLAKSDITFYKPFIEIIMQQASTAINRIKSDLELRESEERFRSLYENATVGMYRTSPDGQILMANPALVRMLGYSSFEELAQHDLNKEGFEPGYSRRDFQKQIEQEGELYGIESDWKRKDGSLIFVRESAKAIREQNGKVIYYEGTVEDISERHQAKIDLQESEAHYRGLFENSPISLWEEDFSAVKTRLEVLKKQGISDIRSYLESHPKEVAHCTSLIRVLDVNKATLKLFHTNNKADLLKPWSNILSPQILYEFREELTIIAEGKINFNWETKSQTVTGKTIDINLSWSVAPGHESDLSKVIISMIDITERKLAEEVLQSSEQKYRSLTEQAADGIFQLDRDGRFIYANSKTCEMLGYSQDEITHLTIYDTYQVQEIAEGKKRVARVNKGNPIRFERLMVARDGHTFPVEISATRMSNDNLQSICRDISERKQVEEKQKILVEEEHSQRIFSEALTKNALSLNSTLNTEELLDAIIDNIQNVIPFEAVSLIMIEKGYGKIVRSEGFVEKGLSAYIDQFRFDFSKYKSFQKVIDSDSYVLIPDTRTDPLWIQDDEASWKILSSLQTPIKEDEQVIGILTLNSSIPNFYNKEHAQQLMAFTNQVSSAMKNTRMFENTQRRMKRMNAMTLIDQAINSSLDLNVSLEVVLMQTLDQLGADASDILMVNMVSNSLTFAKARGFRTNEITKSNLGLGTGLSGQAVLERRIVSIPDLKSAPESYFRNFLIEKEGFISYYCIPLITKGVLKGVMEVHFRRAFEADQEWLEFMEMLAQQTAIAINNAELLNSLQVSNNDLKNAYDTTLQGWVEALDQRDKETEGHSLRVADTTLQLAKLMHVEEKELINIKRGAMLHDIGKMSISDSILNKPGLLSDEEWKVMHRHPEYAFQLLSKTKYLKDALDIPYCHHEKWDGSGYPRGLIGEAIPMTSRIFAIVDVWDALTSDRPYRSAWSQEKALEYIQEQSGKHFDPQVVEVFIKNIKLPNNLHE
jgi:PAS domain S-box-containing protein